MWTGSVRRDQSKCWSDTGERFDPIVVYRIDGTESRTICTKDVLRKQLYAYGLAVVADGEANVQERLIEWKDIFSRHGLRVSLENIEVMLVGPRQKEQYIIRDGKKLKQKDSFVYLGRAICGVGSSPISKRKNLWDVAWT